ncbi:hypothetical protein P3T27_007925 [Kitasatospora sp. MAA19]|nr:hypothetical protein [Kitasatospora sp. MAA19]
MLIPHPARSRLPCPRPKRRRGHGWTNSPPSAVRNCSSQPGRAARSLRPGPAAGHDRRSHRVDAVSALVEVRFWSRAPRGGRRSVAWAVRALFHGPAGSISLTAVSESSAARYRPSRRPTRATTAISGLQAVDVAADPAFVAVSAERPGAAARCSASPAQPQHRRTGRWWLCPGRPRTAARFPSKSRPPQASSPAGSVTPTVVVAAVKSRSAVAPRCGPKSAALRALIQIAAIRCTWAPSAAVSPLSPNRPGAALGSAVPSDALRADARRSPGSPSSSVCFLPSLSRDVLRTDRKRSGQSWRTELECLQHLLTVLQSSSRRVPARSATAAHEVPSSANVQGPGPRPESRRGRHRPARRSRERRARPPVGRGAYDRASSWPGVPGTSSGGPSDNSRMRVLRPRSPSPARRGSS